MGNLKWVDPSDSFASLKKTTTGSVKFSVKIEEYGAVFADTMESLVKISYSHTVRAETAVLCWKPGWKPCERAAHKCCVS